MDHAVNANGVKATEPEPGNHEGLKGALRFPCCKNWQLRESWRLEFRAEFFNLPNHPIFGQPDTSPGSPTYGIIGSTRVDSREVQLALKLVF